ncbi:MAG: hypothetical protein IIX18_04060, partial [Clostridia bacterium]|nr:hypothetical protein [Clostridia bacterium]
SEKSLRRQEIFKTLNKMKNESDLLCYGSVEWLENDSKESVISFKRALDGNEIIFVGNAKNEETSVSTDMISGRKIILSNGSHKVEGDRLILKPHEYIVAE